MKNFCIVSSGDPEKDREELLALARREQQMFQGICPNGCGGMRGVDAYSRECPKCGFQEWRNVPAFDADGLEIDRSE